MQRLPQISEPLQLHVKAAAKMRCCYQQGSELLLPITTRESSKFAMWVICALARWCPLKDPVQSGPLRDPLNTHQSGPQRRPTAQLVAFKWRPRETTHFATQMQPKEWVPCKPKQASQNDRRDT